MHLIKIAIGIISSFFIANISFAMEITKFRKDDESEKSIVLPDSANGLAKQTMEKIIKLGPARLIQIKNDIGYSGNNIGELTEFMGQLDLFFENYAKGNRLLPEEKIVLTSEDEIKMSNFSNYLVNTLFPISFSKTAKVSAEFKEFKEKYDNKGFENYLYKENLLFYALMYFFDDNKLEIQIPAANASSYNNYRFTFLPCSDSNKNSGQPMTLAFKAVSINQELSYLLKAETNNVLSTKLFYGYSSSLAVEVSFEFFAFKVAEDTYRLKVILSTKKPYSSEQTPQKATSFLVKIK